MTIPQIQSTISLKWVDKKMSTVTAKQWDLFPDWSLKKNWREILAEQGGTGSLLRDLSETEALYSPYPVFHPMIKKGWEIPKSVYPTVKELHQTEMIQRWEDEQLRWAFALFPTLFSRYGDFMDCKECGKKMYFTGSTTWEKEKRVIRRYRCQSCGHTENTENEHEGENQ
jgi:Fe2+ or Zn2+ uptake regulation protein